MACPHFVGLVALVLSKDKDLSTKMCVNVSGTRLYQSLQMEEVVAAGQTIFFPTSMPDMVRIDY